MSKDRSNIKIHFITISRNNHATERSSSRKSHQCSLSRGRQRNQFAHRGDHYLYRLSTLLRVCFLYFVIEPCTKGFAFLSSASELHSLVALLPRSPHSGSSSRRLSPSFRYENAINSLPFGEKIIANRYETFQERKNEETALNSL